MKILKYKCTAKGNASWNFSEVSLGNINLLVGDTASGKTRFLNTIFNIGTFIARDNFRMGYWDIEFEQNGKRYQWVLNADEIDNVNSRIIEEKLWVINKEKELLIDRSVDTFIYQNSKLPKLSPTISAISLLKEEDEIRPIYEGFGLIKRRKFSHDALSNVASLEPIPQEIIDTFQKNPTLIKFHGIELGLNATLYILSRFYKEIFNEISENFKIAFPFIAETAILDFSQISKQPVAIEIPVFCIKEKNTDTWVPIIEASSGMQKVLLILTDVYTLAPDSIYIIDEYENSLGINAIDFFPRFLLDLEKNIQFLITSHHPYLINEIPPKNWYIFNRKGTNVTIKYGEELEARFGKSKQKAFTQLINDSFYTDGVG